MHNLPQDRSTILSREAPSLGQPTSSSVPQPLLLSRSPGSRKRKNILRLAAGSQKYLCVSWACLTSTPTFIIIVEYPIVPGHLLECICALPDAKRLLLVSMANQGTPNRAGCITFRLHPPHRPSAMPPCQPIIGPGCITFYHLISSHYICLMKDSIDTLDRNTESIRKHHLSYIFVLCVPKFLGNKSAIHQMRPRWAVRRITCSTAACCAPLPREARTEFSARPRWKLGLCNLQVEQWGFP